MDELADSGARKDTKTHNTRGMASRILYKVQSTPSTVSQYFSQVYTKVFRKPRIPRLTIGNRAKPGLVWSVDL